MLGVCVHIARHRAEPTVFAEASVVPGTVFDFGLGVNVQKWTFLVATLTCERPTQTCDISRILTLSKYSHLAHLPNSEPTDQTWSRSSIQASWSCRTHGGTRTGLPSCTVL